MRDHPFASCWHRWERASEHRASLAEIWNSYIAEHPYDFSLGYEGEGQYVLRVWQDAPMPPGFAVIMGEWLYNLRSTLDYIIWATAVHTAGQSPPPNEARLQYPIYDSEQAWLSNLYRLESLAEHHREMLRSMQPFASDVDANYLGWINRLARLDRHRSLVDGTAYLAVIDPVVQVPGGCQVSLEWGERVLADGRADVARITVSPWTQDMDVTVNPRVGIDPEIAQWSQSPFWGTKRFTDRLTMIQIFVAAEIATYEYDCTGRSRKAYLLTNEFKDKPRARKQQHDISYPARRPVVWRAAGTGTPSTAARFAGEDFPTGPASIGDWVEEDDEEA